MVSSESVREFRPGAPVRQRRGAEVLDFSPALPGVRLGVAALFDLLRLFVKRDLARLHKDGVRIRIVGSREGLSDDILSLIDGAVELTKGNTRLNLNIAFNYGGRGEIVAAVRDVASAPASASRGNLRIIELLPFLRIGGGRVGKGGCPVARSGSHTV